MEFSIDFRELEHALKTVWPDRIRDRSRSAMQESVGYLQGEVQKRTPVDQGIGRGSVFTELRGNSMPELRGIVATAQAYMTVVERGRRPGGRFPPRGPIQAWAGRVLGDASLWFVVARAIARRGTKGHFMFRDAAYKGRRTVEAIFSKHFRGL